MHKHKHIVGTATEEWIYNQGWIEAQVQGQDSTVIRNTYSRNDAKKHKHTVRRATKAETQSQVLDQNTVIQSEIKKHTV
jgi:hypothetical protein